MKYKNLIFVFVFVFTMSIVNALGVTPARTTLDFEPGLAKTIPFEVINSGGQDIGIVITTGGELGEYVSLPVSEASMAGDEKTKDFEYNLKLPNDLEPGLHTGEVFILQIPSSGDQSGASVLATLAVVTQIYVYVPYPGKFANADMVIYNANEGEDVKFVFPIVSAGEFDLTSVRANVEIFNKLDEKVGSFDTKTISVPSGEKREIVYDWAAEISIGEYRAVASVIYDEGILNFEDTFSIGSKDLELKSINVNSFSLGQIAKLEMLVENKWSEPISGAFISTVIKNSNGDVVSQFESTTYDIGALEKQSFVSYWDTAGVRPGTYETEVNINYADKSSTKNLKFQVSENDLTIIGLGYVISDSSGGSDGDGMDTIVMVLIIVIVLLVLINLLWFFMLRKRLK